MVNIPQGFELVTPGIPAGFELVSTPDQQPQAPQGIQPTAEGRLPLPPTPSPEPQGTALGRVAGAFAEPFRETQFGVPRETFASPNQALDAFNEIVRRGVASPIFASIQALGAGAEGAIDALAQTAVEAGLSPNIAQRGARETKALLSEFALGGGGRLAGAVGQVGDVTRPAVRVAEQLKTFSAARKAKTSAPKADVRAFRVIRNTLAKDLGNKGRAEAALRKWVADGADPDALIDLGGENMRRLAQSIASEEPEKALNIITKFRESQPTEIRGALQRAANQKGLIGDDVLDDVQFIKQTKGAELYQIAESIEMPADVYQGQLKRFVQSIAGQKGVKKAIVIANAEGDEALEASLRLALKGEEQTLNIKALQLIKEGVDDVVGKAVRAGEKSTARAITKNKREWLNTIDEVSPEFREARDFYAGQFDTEEALKLGREFTKGSKNAGQVRRELAELNPSEREFYRLGVADALDDVISRTRDVSNKATFVKTEAMRNKIRALLEEDPDSAEEFIGFLQESSKRFERRVAISPRTGSQTQERQFGAARLVRAVRSPAETAIKGIEALEAGREGRITDVLSDAFFVGRPLPVPPVRGQ